MFCPKRDLQIKKEKNCPFLCNISALFSILTMIFYFKYSIDHKKFRN